MLTIPILWLCFLQHLDENSPLGDLLRGVLDVPACQIGELCFLAHDSSWYQGVLVTPSASGEEPSDLVPRGYF